MKRLLASIALWFALAPAARAEACWFEHGVVVVPATVAGVAGDYILDTGDPHTQLHETRAQMEGHADTAFVAEVRVAGRRLADQPIVVADLDARTYAFPTPIAGVIGADVLSAYVVEVSFAPCVVRLWPAGRAPRFRAEASLPMTLRSGLPTVAGAVADGPRTRLGGLVVATGLDAAARLDRALAGVPGAARPEEVGPYGSRRATLRALSLAGTLFEQLPAGLMAAPEGAIGAVGAPVLARWTVRLDFPHGRLLLRRAR